MNFKIGYCATRRIHFCRLAHLLSISDIAIVNFRFRDFILKITKKKAKKSHKFSLFLSNPDGKLRQINPFHFKDLNTGSPRQQPNHSSSKGPKNFTLYSGYKYSSS